MSENSMWIIDDETGDFLGPDDVQLSELFSGIEDEDNDHQEDSPTIDMTDESFDFADLSVEGARERNPAVDERIEELEKEVSRWKARAIGPDGESDDPLADSRTERGKIDLREATVDD